MSRKLPSPRAWRRLSQLLFLALFLVLFRWTDDTGSDEIAWAVNLFFRWDPLVAATVTLATRKLLPILAPSLVILGLTLVTGRSFCGWICPLGTLLDGVGRLLPARQTPGSVRLRQVKYVLLLLTLMSSVLGLQLVGLFDPFSILVRGLTLSVDPAFHSVTTSLFTFLYHHAPGWITALSEPVYAVLRAGVLPHGSSAFLLGGLSLAILLLILGLEALERRFWCRNLCPLGALLSLLARYAPLRRRPRRVCTDCTICWEGCRMDARRIDGHVLEEECIRCMSCQTDCPQGRVAFRWGRPARPRTVLGLSRRAFLGAAVTGIALPAVTRLDPRPRLRTGSLRPPGALPEAEFLSRCVRCGECMKVCIGNALHPELLESGLGGVFAPRLVPRIGYCEHSCTLCGQVCPTGAISKLDEETKRRTVIGLARFDETRCLPYAEGTPCIVCEEHCPVYDKAIRVREVETLRQDGTVVRLQQPYVVPELCIGCGACENRCPLPGPAAIHVEPLPPEDDGFVGGGYGASG